MANIKQVAKEANVSVATVSRVINNKGYVNEETRKLVEKAIKELNYVPNEFARSLYKKTSKSIGVIVPHLNNPFYYGVLEGIEDLAFEKGYKVMLCNSAENSEREAEYIKQFMKYNIDGLIIGSNTEEIKKYTDLNIPLISIDRIISHDVPSVTSDNFGGGAIAAKKLVISGAKNIVHFRGPSILITVLERSNGFNSYLREHGVTCDEVDLAFIDPDPSLIRDYLETHPDTDGIFCDSDYIAALVLRELQLLGKSVPKQVQIIGYDNTSYSQIVIPKLTTISQQMFDIGKEAMEMLSILMNKETLGSKHHIIPVRIIERETTN
ncbi:alanine racemase protein [Haloplasma contractile SSD-17B]|uniref:Alanine racemase protein n=2 Tax=Haloplasma TaxID=471824 RepID=U2EE50_9MOLU|nr:alanine racemase protein [Haloplasma contractile SSD-17B]